MEPGHVMEQEGKASSLERGGKKKRDVKKPFRVH